MNESGQHQPTANPAAIDMVARKWRSVLPVLFFTLLTILVLYRETAMAMVGIWVRSETFTHGFLVLPITIWLIWRIRDQLAPLAPRPNYWILFVLVGTGFVWLLGELATVGVLSQFALTTMLILAVIAFLGLPVARHITFPLAFLYWAVPFGEFALPQLMEWTANFTVLGLRLSGIPVFREGLHFVIPSGSWSVVEACSGVRYIIASLTVGSLFAYLSYRSFKRRLIFFGVALVVPVIANWMRAYLIVMIGHLSGNKLAVGVDHLIYGWLFFGIVIMTMFVIGSRWREDELPPPQGRSATESPVVARAHSSPFILALATMVITSIWPLAEWKIEGSVTPPLNQLDAMGLVPGWPASPVKFTAWSPHFENASADQYYTFGSAGRELGVYLAYYRNQDDNHKMVTSGNVTVRSADPVWAKVGDSTRKITFNQQSITVRTAELRSADSTRLVVWQWYWVNGHLTASDYIAKAYIAWSRLLGYGDDSAVIFLYTPKGEAGDGEALMDAFIGLAAPEIESVLDRTREIR